MRTRTVSSIVLLLQFPNSTIRAQTNFAVQPMSVKQAEGLEAVFECLYPGETAYDWSVNGTILSSLSPNIASDIVSIPSVGGSRASLTILARPEYNNTVVQCEAIVRVNGTPDLVLSDIAHLTVQGPLDSVVSLHFVNESMSASAISISWEAPFSLNLTTAEPDIQYCVDVYNVSEGEDLLESRCDITETSYTFTPDNPSPDNLFDFTVTPRSNVPSSLNGTRSQPVRGFVIGVPLPIPSEHVKFQTNSNLVPIMFQFPAYILGTSPGRQPTHYTVKLRYIDYDDQQSCSCPASHVTVNNTVISTLQCDSTCTIERHRLCNAVIIPSNSAGNSSSCPELEISTHDVQQVKAILSNPGQIDISCSYLGGSTDEGFFTIIYVSSNHSDIMYRVAVRNGIEPTTNLLLNGFQYNDYKVVVYDLSTGMPEDKPAATPQEVTNITHVAEQDPEEPVTSLPTPPEVTSPGNGMICISCSFSDPRTTGCIGVIHSAELVNLTLTILPVSRSDNNQPHNSNCTTDMLTGDYSVAVFGQLVDRLETAPAVVTLITVMSTTTTQDPTTTTPTVVHSDITVLVTVGTGLAIVVVVMVLVVMAVAWICIVRARRTQRKTFNPAQDQPHESSVPVVDGRVDWSQTFAGIEQPNEAYSLVTKKNPSYKNPSKRKRRNQRTFNIQSQPPQLASISESTHSGRVYVNTVAQGSEDCCQYENVLPQDGMPNATYVNVQYVFD